MAREPAATKACAVCGRPFANRGRWRRRDVWEQVRYCSRACRSKRRSTLRATPVTSTTTTSPAR